MTTKTKAILAVIFIALLIGAYFLGRSQGKKSCKKAVTPKDTTGAKTEPVLTVVKESPVVETAEVLSN